MQRTKGSGLSVHGQVISGSGPATHDEGAAWKYVEELVAEVQRGEQVEENLKTLRALGAVWGLKHMRADLRGGARGRLLRIGAGLRNKRRRFAAAVAAARAGRAA